jgi:hypothetical protein
LSDSGRSQHYTARPTPGLDLLTRLLTDGDRLRAWLQTCDDSVRQPFTKATLTIGSLRLATDLAMPALLDELRCRHRRQGDLQDMNADHLHQCADFLDWVLTLVLAAPKDSVLTRGVVRSASAMYADAGRDLAICERVLREPIADGDRTTPSDLLAIGEIGAAFETGRAALPGPVGVRAAGWSRRSTGARSPHVGSTTLDALLRYSNDHRAYDDALGVSRASALLRHINGCRDCALAYGARARLLEAKPAELSAVGSRV